MSRTSNLFNLIAGAPARTDRLLGRLTAVFRRDTGRSARPNPRAQSGQSPPRRPFGLWLHRLRIESIRTEHLSRHLRRDIGLDR